MEIWKVVFRDAVTKEIIVIRPFAHTIAKAIEGAKRLLNNNYPEKTVYRAEIIEAELEEN